LRAASLLATLLCATDVALAQKFEIRLLDTYGQLTLDAPRRVARGGAAVGLGVIPSGDNLPVAWDANGTNVLALLPGHEMGDALGFNGSGLVVGSSSDVVVVGPLIKVYDHAALWQGGQVIDVRSLVHGGPPLELKWAVDVDTAGVIVGTGRDTSAQRLRGWRLENGLLTDLGVVAATGGVTVADANDAGQIVGTAEDGSGWDHAFLWQNGSLGDLHVSGGVPGLASQAFAVNESGIVVGTAEFDPGGPVYERAAAWTPAGLVDLGLIAGEQSWAFGVNAQGDIVGGALTPNLSNTAVLWRGGSLIDLNTKLPPNSPWWLMAARAVADDGRIVGEGSYQGSLRAFLLEPLCESCARFCLSRPNSTGQAARISASGWESVAANDFGLLAGPVPHGAVGLFFYGGAKTQVPFGNGLRCVAPGSAGLFRLPAQTAGATGVLSQRLDLGQSPGVIAPGATWHFQAWYRDPAGGGAGFDLSDGLLVQFLP